MPTSSEQKTKPKKSHLNKTSQRVVASFRHRGHRRHIVDSSASFHLVAEGSLTKNERATDIEIDEAIPTITANGEVEVTHQCQVYVQELGQFCLGLYYRLRCSRTFFRCALR